MEFVVPLVLAIGLITTLALLLFGLISASWQVLLVILIAGLVLTEKLIRQANVKTPESISQKDVAQTKEKTREKDRGFVYRGIYYEKNEKTLNKDEEPRKEALVGKYRGADCTYIKQEEHIPAKNNPKIKYRGASLGVIKP